MINHHYIKFIYMILPIIIKLNLILFARHHIRVLVFH